MKRRVAVAALLAALVALAARAAAAADDASICEGDAWEALAPEDVPADLLNLTLAEFDEQFIPSEDNPDDGQRPVWVPCNQLGVEVLAACQQVEGEAAVFQLRVGLNCSHQAPVPHFDSASFTANVTLAPEGDAVAISDVDIELDPSHATLPCNDVLCAVCPSPDVCDQCQPGTELSATGACLAQTNDGAPVPTSTGPAGASPAGASPSRKSCPEGQFWNGWSKEGSAVCLDCYRPGCRDCAYCDAAIFGPYFCWNSQYCIPPNSGGRPCLDGYHYSQGGCALCRVTIPNCAFCNACTAGSPKCINGAVCVQCSPGYTIGSLGYCRSTRVNRSGRIK